MWSDVYSSYMVSSDPECRSYCLFGVAPQTLKKFLTSTVLQLAIFILYYFILLFKSKILAEIMYL